MGKRSIEYEVKKKRRRKKVLHCLLAIKTRLLIMKQETARLVSLRNTVLNETMACNSATKKPQKCHAERGWLKDAIWARQVDQLKRLNLI